MKHTRAALCAGLTLTAASVGAFVPAHAADTTVTFELTSEGALQISAPATETLTSGGGLSLLGDSVSGTFSQPVRVTDSDGSLVGGWVATVTSTDFTNGTGETASVIDKSNVRYGTGAVAFNGVGLNAEIVQTLTPVAATNDEWTITAVAVGNSEASWSPTVQVQLPDAGLAVGTYSGVITHSVT